MPWSKVHPIAPNLGIILISECPEPRDTMEVYVNVQGE